MNTNLAVLESGLVPVYTYGEERENIVDARELHDFLEIGKDFTTWIKSRLDNYGFEEGIDYILTLTKVGERKNVTRHDYYLKIDTAKEIAMVENNEQGRTVRKYFIEVEKKFRQQNNMQPMSMEDLIIMQATNMKEMRLHLEKQEQEMKLLKLDTQDTKEKVVNMTDYLTSVPDRAKLETALKRLAREKFNRDYGKTCGEVYKILKMQYGFDVSERVKNKKIKMNKEREENNLKPYSDSTLKQKVSGLSILEEHNMLNETMEIVAGLMGK